MRTPRWLPALLCTGATLASPLLRAQPATPATSSTDDTITLSPFEVSGDKAHGYVASESITGTRIASKLQDLPFAVDVVTHDFMEDFAAYSLNEQLAMVPGFSPSEVTGQFQLRGFASPTTLVDGFRRFGLVDTVDIDRIEVIKGSAASIYGAIQPGGAVNILTYQPSTTPTAKLDFGGGSDGFYRAAIYSSGPVGSSDKLFYRVDASDQFTKYSEQFASQHKAYISAKLMYKPNENNTFKVDIEHSEDYEHPFTQVLTITEKQTMPWAGNSITESQYYGMAVGSLLNYNYAGPESYLHSRVSSATFSAEHKQNEHWSTKFAANIFVNPVNDQAVGSGAYYPYGTGNITVTNGVVNQPFAPVVKDQPQADWKPQRGGGAQLDNLFIFDTGPIGHKLLLTADYYELTQRTVSLVPTTAVGSQATDYYALYSPYNPSGAPYYTMQSTWNAALGYGWNTTLYGQNPALYNGVSNDNWTAAGDYGLFGSERASFFKDRLILMAGGRWDYVKNQVKNYNIAAVGTSPALGAPEPAVYQAFAYNTSAWTYQLGASFKITSNLNAYANKSTAFNPQPQIDSYTGEALPNNKSSGWEYGFKTSLLQNRLNLSVSRFEINQYNLVQSETDPVSGLKDTILSGEQQAKGFEFAGNYQVTDAFTVLGDWGYVQSQVLNSAPITFLQGLPARRVPRDNVGLTLRYEFTHGFAKGLYLLGSAKYYSKSLVNLGSGKSLIPGPASATVGSTTSMYYVAATNTTYTGTVPSSITSIAQKITATPVVNVPFPGNGLLPYPAIAAGTVITTPVGTNGLPLPVNASGGGTNYVAYTGAPTGVFVDDGREYNFNAPYAVFDVGAGYSWRMRRWTNKVQVNVKNVGNRKYTYGSGAPGAPLQVVGT